jgi:hypothetical protein
MTTFDLASELAAAGLDIQPRILPYLSAVVVFEDGRELQVACDQRDQRRALLPPNIGGAGIVSTESDPVGFLRGAAWAYLTRLGQYTGTWREFDSSVPFVLPNSDAEEGARPTNPATAG